MSQSSGMGFAGVISIPMPDGGAAGTVLTKQSLNDYDYDWELGGGIVLSIVAGDNMLVDDTDPGNPVVALQSSINGVTVNGVVLTQLGVGTNFLDEQGNYSSPPEVDSVSGGTNINVSGPSSDPAVNLDAAIAGVSVNGVTLTAVGAVTDFLNAAGAYSVPAGDGNLYDNDGTLTANRTILANDGDFFVVNQYDVTAADFLQRSKFQIDPSIFRLQVTEGDGIGGTVGTVRDIRIDDSQMLIADQANTEGLFYGGNYATNGVANRGDRWIVDRGFVDLEALSTVLVVRTLSDLPAPSGGAIDVSAFNQIIFRTASLDLGSDKLLTTSSALTMTGLSALTTVLTSSNADGTIDSNGFFLSLQEMNVANTGSNTRSIRHTGAGSVFFIGATVIQDDIELGTFGSVTIEDSQLEGFVNFTTANVFSSVTFRTVNVVQTAAISVLVFDVNATIGRLEIDNVLYAGISGGHLIEIENPDEFVQATIRNSPLGIIGEVLQCTPVSSSNFTPVTSNVRGACVDANNNLITTDITSGNIVRYVGLTSTVDVTIAAPSSNVQGVTWYKGDLYSADFGGAVRQHDGFSTTILSTVNMTELVIDITFAGADICLNDNTTDLIIIKEGFSDTTKSSFAIGTNNAGLTFDGINLLVLHDAVVSVMKGITGLIQYEFETPVDFSVAIDVHDTGFMIADNNRIDLINHPVTFDQSSARWEMSDNSGAAAPSDSSDRGGSSFDNGNTYLPVTVVQDEFTDIDDGATDIFYALFSENEKAFLHDETNGELEWTSARTRGQIITGTVNVARVGTTDRQLELVIVINDEVQDDSKASVFLTNTSPVTLTTLPVSKTLGSGDKVKLQFKDLSSANGEEFALAKLSIV